MGELHLEIATDRLQREYGVPVTVGRMMVSYREALASEMTVVRFTYDKTLGTKRHFAHLTFALERLPLEGEEGAEEQQQQEEAAVAVVAPTPAAAQPAAAAGKGPGGGKDSGKKTAAASPAAAAAPDGDAGPAAPASSNSSSSSTSGGLRNVFTQAASTLYCRVIPDTEDAKLAAAAAATKADEEEGGYTAEAVAQLAAGSRVEKQGASAAAGGAAPGGGAGKDGGATGELKVLPAALSEALASGIAACFGRGPLLGYPVTGLRVTVIERECFVSNDTTPAAIRAAVARCFEQGMTEGGAQLLEPVMAVEVVSPDSAVGDVISDMTAHKRGQIRDVTSAVAAAAAAAGGSSASGSGSGSSGSSGLSSKMVVRGLVPLREMVGYATFLRSRTAGEGTFSMQFSHYAHTGDGLQQQIVANPFLA